MREASESALYNAGVSWRVEEPEKLDAWQSVVGMHGEDAKHAYVGKVQPRGGDVHGAQ